MCLPVFTRSTHSGNWICADEEPDACERRRNSQQTSHRLDRYSCANSPRFQVLDASSKAGGRNNPKVVVGSARPSTTARSFSFRGSGLDRDVLHVCTTSSPAFPRTRRAGGDPSAPPASRPALASSSSTWRCATPPFGSETRTLSLDLRCSAYASMKASAGTSLTVAMATCFLSTRWSATPRSVGCGGGVSPFPLPVPGSIPLSKGQEPGIVSFRTRREPGVSGRRRTIRPPGGSCKRETGRPWMWTTFGRCGCGQE